MTTMHDFEINRDDQRPLRFKGELVAEVSDHSHQSGPTNTRWTELSLYRTAAGATVCERVYRTQWQGESDTHEAILIEAGAKDRDDRVVAFFEFGRLAQELYRAAGLDIAEAVP